MGRTARTGGRGQEVRVDLRDVADWCGAARMSTDPGTPEWGEWIGRYVEEHPRASSAGVAAAQRLALLRRLAAGPAGRAELLRVMREAAGWVGADDLENRLRELRGGDRRSGAAARGLPLRGGGERWWLDEPLPLLSEEDRRALGFAKAMIMRLDGPLAERAAAALDRLLPGLAALSGARVPVRYRASAADLQRFDAAAAAGRPVRVRYFSLNSGRERTYDLVPVEYVTIGATVKAACVPVDEDGKRTGDDRQFALDRLRAVENLPDWPTPPPEAVRLRRAQLVLDVSDGLYQVLRERNVFGVADADAVQSEYDDSWRVTGSFPLALGWDVMEQLCAWAGNVQVHAPLWLVNAVCRRLRAGLRVMEEGAGFELVKPEPQRVFATHGEAVSADASPPPPGPRKLAPPRAPADRRSRLP